jgi:hypothetical protein
MVSKFKLRGSVLYSDLRELGEVAGRTGERENAPASNCRKVADAPDHREIEIWCDGLHTRSFLYCDARLEGARQLMESSIQDPVCIDSREWSQSAN